LQGVHLLAGHCLHAALAREALSAAQLLCLALYRLVERFLLDNYKPHQLSTYALTLYRYDYVDESGGKPVPIGAHAQQPAQVACTHAAPVLCCAAADIWDTAGQERFNSMHSSYYYRAHACIMVFDVTRKITYKNLEMWVMKTLQRRQDVQVCACCALPHGAAPGALLQVVRRAAG
jgi:Rab-like protein 2